jgi:hypothetical protein
MHWLSRRVSSLWLYPVAAFGGIALLPWWESKSGDRLPLATAYGNQFPGWQSVLLAHLAATAALSRVLVGLHLALARLVWKGRARPGQSRSAGE